VTAPSSHDAVPSALRAAYDKAGQAHVFKFIDEGKVRTSRGNTATHRRVMQCRNADELIPASNSSSLAMQVTAEEAKSLIAQLAGIDVELVNDLFTSTMAAQTATAAPVASTLRPAEGVTKLSAASPSESAAWEAAGLKAIAEGKVAALTLAGGQGTRLGFDRPKGEYDIGLPSHKTLFQLQAERIVCLKARASAEGAGGRPVSLPWYVMTSPMTDADTRAFLAENRYFGLPEADVVLFEQGTLPCLDFDGKIMLESAGRVAEAPDGNGGIYRALHKCGVIADMARRGVVGMHVFAVDNAAVRVADPVFFGYCLGMGADVGSKVCPKAGPHEKVGVLCLRDGVYSVVEYSEMDKATAELRAEGGSGELVFNAGNLCIHFYSRAFLESACSPATLPKVYHVAKKAIPFADPATGRTLSKEAMAGRGNTGIKLESFIFDVFPAAKTMAVLEIRREDEFAPVKNAPGSAEDSPDTARQMLLGQHARWIATAGGKVTGSGGVEVSPLLSYAGEGLQGLAGKEITAPAVLVLPAEAAAVQARVAPGVAVVPV